MIMCTTCLSYLNLYCSFDKNTGEWTCPICKRINAPLPPSQQRNSIQMRQSIMTLPMVEYHQNAAGHTNDDNDDDDDNDALYQIRNHGDEQNPKIRNSTVPVDGGGVVALVIDGHLSPSEVESILVNLNNTFFNQDDKKKNYNKDQVKIGIIIYTSIVHIYQIGIQGGVASADVYPLDYEYNNEDNHRFIPEYDYDSVELEEDRMYIGSWDQAMFCIRAYFGLHHYHPTMMDNNAEVTTSKEDTMGQLNKATKIPLSRREMLRQKREARLKNDTNQHNKLNLDHTTAGETAQWLKMIQKDSSNKNKTRSPQYRCTGEAVSYAFSLIVNVEERCNGRILLFTNGCPNFGKGTVVYHQHQQKYQSSVTYDDEIDEYELGYASQYFHSMGKFGAQNGIGIDVLCSGNRSNFGIQALQSLVNPSAGYVLTHSSFEETSLQSNLRYLLLSTAMSWTRNQDIGSVRLGIASPNWMNTINGCLLDLRMSSNMTPTSFNGIGEPVDGHSHHILPNERATFVACNSRSAEHGLPSNNMPSPNILHSTRTRLKLGRYDPKASVAVRFELVNDLHNDTAGFVYFQFITRFIHPRIKSVLVTRVATQRIPICKSESGYEFYDNLNENVLSSLLAKEAAYRCMIQDTSEGNLTETVIVREEDIEKLVSQTKKDLDTTVNLISNAYFDAKKSR